MTERWRASAVTIAGTVARLRSGALIAFPTDTLYAIAARAADQEAVRRLYAAKRRPLSQPLIWLVNDAAQVEPFALVSPEAKALMDRYWPGPLTLVLPSRGPEPTLAVRSPAHQVALQLLSQLGEPVASSSANRAGEAPPSDAETVIAGLGEDIDLVLDGGPCPIGTPSTILDLSQAEPRILRQGALVIPGTLPSASGGG